MIFHRNQNSDGHKSSRVWLSVYDLGSRSHCIIKNESVLEQRRAVVMPVVAHKPVSHRVFGPISSSLSVNGSYYFNNGVANASSNGAPTTRPSAYTDIKCPAIGMLILKSLAISGSSPIITTSIIPIPKPPNARCIKFFFIFSVMLFTLMFVQTV